MQADKIRRGVAAGIAAVGLGGLIWGVGGASAGWREPAGQSSSASWMALAPAASASASASAPSTGPASHTASHQAATAHPIAVGYAPMADRASAPDASASGPREATAEERSAFLAECVQPLRTQRYRDAVRRCTAYTEHPALAGQAHAALAAAYSAPDHADPRASARHAESSAAAGDARGQFMAALHMLSGHTDQPFDLGQAESWLSSAAQQRVPNAQALLLRLQEARSCRTPPSFKLLDAPVFCLFKPELDQLLREQGMLAADSRTDHAWSERWQAGAALAGAAAVELDFDRSPVDELLRLARFTYRFDPAAAAQRLPGLAQALKQKYGTPQAGQALAAPGGTALWRLDGGVELRLLRASDGALAIEYRHAARWQARAEHWAQAERALQLARLRRDQAAL